MSHKAPSPLARAVTIAAVLVVVQTLLVLWFAWPAQNAAPRDLPVVVAGPGPAAAAVADRLRTERPGAFDITIVADESAADAALRERSAYAAFLAGPQGITVHVASAASPAVAALITQAAGPSARVVDVVPAPADDPRGAGLAAGFLPLVIVSIAAGAALALAVAGRLARVVGLVLYAALAGSVAAAALQATGVLAGRYLLVAGAVGLVALAIAATVAGLGAVLGRAGVALAAVLVFLLGNPLSGLALAPEMLPQPWGALGQYLPPGAAVTLVRSVGFFDGAGAERAWLVLAAYAVVGLVLAALGGGRRSTPPAADPALERPASTAIAA